VVCAVTRAAAIARASEAKTKKPTSPQQSMLSSIGRDLDRYETYHKSCYSVIGDKPFLWSKAKFDPSELCTPWTDRYQTRCDLLPCVSGVSAGMVRVWVAHEPYLSALEIRSIYIKCYVNSAVYFTLLPYGL